MQTEGGMERSLDKYISAAAHCDPVRCTGSVTSVRGLLIESRGPRSMIGEVCLIKVPSLNTSVLAEVVGLEGPAVHLMAFGGTKGIEVGCTVTASGRMLEVPVGPSLLGRVIDATGQPYPGSGAARDGKRDIAPEAYYPAVQDAPNPLERHPINRRISTGIRAIDGLLTVGRGQRLGIFSATGVGKSTMISMIARNTNADVNVIALIGERGREVLDFIRGDLGEEGLKRSVVVVATGDQSAIARLRAAYVATAVAEYFRDQGKDVMLLFDSVTRFAHAQREIGLATGEPPAQRGYPPSVFDMLPKLLERTGTAACGSITAFYSVLVDSDDIDEPISDKVRATLDGHIILSRALAAEQHYPAVDVLSSISRLSKRVTGPYTQRAATRVKRWISLYSEHEDMINAGVYQKGSSAEIDEAIDKHRAIEEFLCQEEREHITQEETLKALSELSGIEIPADEYRDSFA